jgi:ADP-L-glycero-D-manno-heptose 6-epimerase
VSTPLGARGRRSSIENEDFDVYVITGGAGFIGSNVAAALDNAGADIVISDWLGSNDLKWRNIAKRRVFDVVPPEATDQFLIANRGKIRGVVHMGAISTTTESDVDAIVRNNIRVSIDLWTYCAKERIPFIYASSGATYGNGQQGFLDRFDAKYLSLLRPLNPYGWSKNVFDRWVLRGIELGAPGPPRWAGLKFFNVYGPNEYHKGDQRSVAVQLHAQIRDLGRVQLFCSENPQYPNGGQQRDFVWVGDCVRVVLWALEDPGASSGLYNVGSGQARSFLEKAKIIFKEMGVEPDIEFIELPANLKGKYQYYTCANMNKLRLAGFSWPFTNLEDGLRIYIRDYLEAADPFC